MRLCVLMLSMVAIMPFIGSASAATYKISVQSSLETFSLDGYFLGAGAFENISRDVEGINDPVLENFPWQNFIDGAFSRGGSMRFTEVFYEQGAYPDDNTYWRGSACTGVFVLFGRCDAEFQGRLTDSFINLTSSTFFSLYQINSESGTIDAVTDLDYFWRNALGENSVNNGETIRHRIEGISISQVPVPASGLLMLLSLVGLGGAHMMRRRAGA